MGLLGVGWRGWRVRDVRAGGGLLVVVFDVQPLTELRVARRGGRVVLEMFVVDCLYNPWWEAAWRVEFPAGLFLRVLGCRGGGRWRRATRRI